MLYKCQSNQRICRDNSVADSWAWDVHVLIGVCYRHYWEHALGRSAWDASGERFGFIGMRKVLSIA